MKKTISTRSVISGIAALTVIGVLTLGSAGAADAAGRNCVTLGGPQHICVPNKL